MAAGARRPDAPRRPLAAGLLCAALVAACVPDLPAATASPEADATPQPVQVVVVSTSVWAGEATVLVALADAANRPVGGPDLATSAVFTPAGAGADGSGPAAAGILVPGDRPLYAFSASLPTPGRWHLVLSATGVAGVLAGATELTVRDPGAVPSIGAAAPAAETPTAPDVGGDLTQLTSDPEAEAAFYQLSPADALRAGRPFAFVLDSAGFRETVACGGALALLHHLSHRYPQVAVIHAEPFVTSVRGGTLMLDPPDGPARLAPWSLAWGLGDPAHGTSSVPWIFVVGSDGRVRASFQGIIGSEELAHALDEVSQPGS